MLKITWLQAESGETTALALREEHRPGVECFFSRLKPLGGGKKSLLLIWYYNEG